MNEQYSVEVLPCLFTSRIPVILEITSNLVMHAKGEKGVGRAACDNNPVNCCLIFLLNVILAPGVCRVPLIAHDTHGAAPVLAQSAVEHFGGFPKLGTPEREQREPSGAPSQFKSGQWDLSVARGALVQPSPPALPCARHGSLGHYVKTAMKSQLFYNKI